MSIFASIFGDTFIYILKQSLSKDKKHHKQLNIKLEETKPSMFSKDNIDELYP